MTISAPPAFGKRTAPGAPDAARASDPHAAFFAAARAELADAEDHAQLVVPFSWKAAWLAGLVVGCALAGFDVHGQAGAQELSRATSTLGLRLADTGNLMPALILLGLVGGARITAFSAILVHVTLACVGVTSRLAYAAAGAAASAAFAAVLLKSFGHTPPHGWAVEVAAGAGAGLLYRVIAGARSAST